MENEQRWETVCETLGKVESTNSRIQKSLYLRSCRSEDELKRLLKYTLDFHNLYGVTLEEHGKCTPFEPAFGGFVETLDLVLQHHRSPNVLRDYFALHPCKWFARVVNHDLRCGLGVKTINTAFPELIPEFSIQLCAPYDSRIEMYDPNWIVEPKFDGIRGLIAQFDQANPSCLSRNGKELFNTEFVCNWVKNLYCALPALSHNVLDGEFVAEDWNRTVTTLHTQSAIPSAKNLKFMCFDAIQFHTFPYDDRPLEERRHVLEGLEQFCTPESPVQVVRSLRVPNLDSAWHIATALHQSGYEGAVVKHLGSKYVGKRTDQWTKLKFYHTVDVTIKGAAEGKGRLVGTLGALLVEYGRYKTLVGSGFDDETRAKLWAQRDSIVGTKCEITYQELTEDSMRFPIFVRMRPDK